MPKGKTNKWAAGKQAAAGYKRPPKRRGEIDYAERYNQSVADYVKGLKGKNKKAAADYLTRKSAVR